jgi:hypothetical protein
MSEQYVKFGTIIIKVPKKLLYTSPTGKISLVASLTPTSNVTTRNKGKAVLLQSDNTNQIEITQGDKVLYTEKIKKTKEDIKKEKEDTKKQKIEAKKLEVKKPEVKKPEVKKPEVKKQDAIKEEAQKQDTIKNEMSKISLAVDALDKYWATMMGDENPNNGNKKIKDVEEYKKVFSLYFNNVENIKIEIFNLMKKYIKYKPFVSDLERHIVNLDHSFMVAEKEWQERKVNFKPKQILDNASIKLDVQKMKEIEKSYTESSNFFDKIMKEKFPSEDLLRKTFKKFFDEQDALRKLINDKIKENIIYNLNSDSLDKLLEQIDTMEDESRGILYQMFLLKNPMPKKEEEPPKSSVSKKKIDVSKSFLKAKNAKNKK